MAYPYHYLRIIYSFTFPGDSSTIASGGGSSPNRRVTPEGDVRIAVGSDVRVAP